MKKKLTAFLLIITLLLTGCAGAADSIATTPNETTPPSQALPQTPPDTSSSIGMPILTATEQTSR